MSLIKKRKYKYWGFYIAMVFPALFVYIFVITYPILNSVYISFFKLDRINPDKSKFVGFHNYLKFLFNPRFWIAFKNNMLIVAVSVFVQIPLGFFFAYMFFRNMVKFTSFFQAVVFFPTVISTVVIGIVWGSIFSNYGILSKALKLFTGDSNLTFLSYFNGVWTAIIPVLFVIVWASTGFYMIVFLANLQRVGVDIIEAALIDGATEFQVFWQIIVPILKGVLVTNSILAISGSLKSFDLIYALNGGTSGVGGYNDVLASLMYRTMSSRGEDPGGGAAVSVIMIVISLILILFVNLTGKKFSTDEE